MLLFVAGPLSWRRLDMRFGSQGAWTSGVYWRGRIMFTITYWGR